MPSTSHIYPPDLASRLAQVPRGNTQKHVNRDVLRYLLTHEATRLARPGLRWLDAPCGRGEFLTQVHGFWPQAVLSGTDLRPEPPAVPGTAVHYEQANLSQHVPFAGAPPFDVLTCISGIMCFANTAQFIGQAAERLAPGGLLLVSNDNCLTVRDRLSYLFTGRVRRFKLLFADDEANFELVQHQELARLFAVNGVALKRVEYTALYTEDWLFLPLALLLWPWQWWQLRRAKSAMPQALRRQLFGFRSLLYRHYFFVGEKQAPAGS